MDMDRFGSLLGLLLGFWAPTFTIAILVMGFFVYRQSTSRRWDLEKTELSSRLERDKLEFQSYTARRNDDYATREMAELIRVSLNTSFSELASRFTATLERELSHRAASIQQALISARGQETGLDADALEQSVKDAVEKAVMAYTKTIAPAINAPVEDRITATTLIREVSHALNTPLSHMEILASTRLTPPIDAGCSSKDFINALNSLKSSINICKSYLAAFRQMVLVSGQSLLWSPDSIGSALRAACSVYAPPDSELEFNITVPDVIRGYSNNLIVALLLPLLENAIEASPPNESIAVTGEERDGSIEITVANKAVAPAEPSQMLKSGFTTKGGHDGLGLSIVQNLISIIPAGRIEAEVINHDVRFVVSLPVEGAS